MEELAGVFGWLPRAKTAKGRRRGRVVEGQKIVLSWLVSIVSPRPSLSLSTPLPSLYHPISSLFPLFLLSFSFFTVFNFRLRYALVPAPLPFFSSSFILSLFLFCPLFLSTFFFFLPFILIRLVLTASTSTGGGGEATHGMYTGMYPSANPFSPFFHAHTPLPLPAHPPNLPRSSAFSCLFTYFLCFLSNPARNSNWSWLFNIIGRSKEKGFGGHW